MNVTIHRSAPLLSSLVLLIAACGSGAATPGASRAPSPSAPAASTAAAATSAPAATSAAPATSPPAATSAAPATTAPTEAATPTAEATTPAATSAAPASPAGFRAVYVSTGPIGVNPFLQLIADGLNAGGTECGVTVKVVESADIASMADNLQAAVDEKYDLIVANSFDSVQEVTRLAGEHPDQKWAIVDSTIDSPNVRGLLFKEHEGTFLLGATLGLLASGDYPGFPKSARIGEVGAVDLPFIRRWSVGFEEGVKYVDPSATLDLGWATGFNDPATSKELALAQNAKGAQYIFAFSAAGNTGIFEAAKDKGFFTTGVDTDQRKLDPAHIIESMVKRTDVGVKEAVCDLGKGQFTGGVKAYGLAEGGVGPAFLTLTDLQPPSSLPQAVQDKVRQLADKIKSGEIKVTDFLAQPAPSASPSETPTAGTSKAP
jgi:basic membrane protein A